MSNKIPDKLTPLPRARTLDDMMNALDLESIAALEARERLENEKLMARRRNFFTGDNYFTPRSTFSDDLYERAGTAEDNFSLLGYQYRVFSILDLSYQSAMKTVLKVCPWLSPTAQQYRLPRWDGRGIKTAGISIVDLTINSEFWNKLKAPQRAGLILHELLHVYLRHHARRYDLAVRVFEHAEKGYICTDKSCLPCLIMSLDTSSEEKDPKKAMFVFDNIISPLTMDVEVNEIVKTVVLGDDETYAFTPDGLGVDIIPESAKPTMKFITSLDTAKRAALAKLEKNSEVITESAEGGESKSEAPERQVIVSQNRVDLARNIHVQAELDGLHKAALDPTLAPSKRIITFPTGTITFKDSPWLMLTHSIFEPATYELLSRNKEELQKLIDFLSKMQNTKIVIIKSFGKSKKGKGNKDNGEGKSEQSGQPGKGSGEKSASENSISGGSGEGEGENDKDKDKEGDKNDGSDGSDDIDKEDNKEGETGDAEGNPEDFVGEDQLSDRVKDLLSGAIASNLLRAEDSSRSGTKRDSDPSKNCGYGHSDSLLDFRKARVTYRGKFRNSLPVNVRRIDGTGELRVETYKRLNPRDDPRDAILTPGNKYQSPLISVVVDTSGSMGSGPESPLGLAWAALSDVIRELGARAHVWTCDTKESFAGVHEGTLGKLPAQEGGGGTDPGPAIIAALKGVRGERPNVVYVITDGYAYWPKDPYVGDTLKVVSPVFACFVTSDPWAIPDWIKPIHLVEKKD